MSIVSVVIPAYNGESYIKESIQSILDQSFSDFELIVVDDASTDATRDVIFSIKDERIRYLRHEENRGTAAATCTGLDAASGKYIALLDQDDIALPQRLEMQVRFMNGQPRIAISGSQMQCFGATGEKISVPLADGDIKANLLPGVHNLVNPTIMIRRDFMLKKGLRWKSENGIAFDLGLFVDAMLCGAKFANLPDALVNYRIHENQQTTINKDYYPLFSPIRLKVLETFFQGMASDERMQLEPLLQWTTPPALSREAVAAGLSHFEKAKLSMKSIHGENREKVREFLIACEQRWRQALA